MKYRISLNQYTDAPLRRKHLGPKTGMVLRLLGKSVSETSWRDDEWSLGYSAHYSHDYSHITHLEVFPMEVT